MCGIVGSFDRDEFCELMELNKGRGNSTFSVTTYRPSNTGLKIENIQQEVGEFKRDMISFYGENVYFIGHLQSPTKTVNINHIHPAKADESALWHNGMLVNYNGDWDTGTILSWLEYEGFNALDNIHGAFGCLYYKDHKLYLFRNSIIPIYIDDDLNISSTKMDSGRLIPANVVYEVRFDLKEIIEVVKFNNKHNPYGI